MLVHGSVRGPLVCLPILTLANKAEVNFLEWVSHRDHKYVPVCRSRRSPEHAHTGISPQSSEHAHMGRLASLP